MLPGKLFLIPSSISEADPCWVIPDKVRELLPRLKYFVVENEKSARRFLKSVSPAIAQENLHIEVMNRHGRDNEFKAWLNPAVDGHDIGLLSEAGCPAVADPGAGLVAEAHRQGIGVVPLAGPSSVMMALMASGLNGQRFCFYGYLPVQTNALAARLRVLERESKAGEQTQIFIETPYRNDKLLKTLLATCRDDTLLCLAAGITSAYESIRTQSIGIWKKDIPVLGKVPCVFLMLAG